ncbi:MAG: hypothetical protein ACLPVI_06225 [Dehalococcoidales bacterium]
MVLITNCSKKNNDQLSNSKPKLKTDTVRIRNLPPQDSLNLIKIAFGQGILSILKQNIDSTITDFNILSDTIVNTTDTAVYYLTTINFKGVKSKNIGITAQLSERKKSTEYIVIPITTYMCGAGCSCCIGPYNGGGYWVCPCPSCYGSCPVLVFHTFIILF